MLFKNLKVCFIAGTLGQGGAERQLYYILSALVRNGAEVNLICLTSGEYWEKPILELGVVIHQIPQVGRLKKLWTIIKVVKQIKPRIIQSMHFYTNLYAGVAGKLAGIVSIGAIRSNFTYELKAHNSLIGKLCYKLPNYMVANSMEAFNTAVEFGLNKKKLFYLSNAVDTDKFIAKKKENNNSTFNVLSIGRLDFNKRFDRLIRITAALKDKNIFTTIIGDGELKDELLKLSKEAGLNENNISFPGNVSNPEAYYTQADAFVFTSASEGTPNVILEAMACALAVVTSSVGNLPYIIKNGENGFLIPPDDEQQFIDVIKKLISSENLRNEIGNNARKTILEEYSVPVLAPKLSEIYSQILDI